MTDAADGYAPTQSPDCAADRRGAGSNRGGVATARVRRSGLLVGIVDIDSANEAGELLAIGRASYATAA
jgi:hypothetical protein